MLKSIKQLYGDKLGATDGEIGRVKDFYFEDQNWAIRYLVVDPGVWLSGRQVLLSPHAFSGLQPSGKVLRVNLTREQIERSPSIELHKPLSRQYEEEYYRYYGWPYYWHGEALWGMSGFPILELPVEPRLSEKVVAAGPRRPDAHLRSTQAVNGYCVQGTEATSGHICDFLVDDQTWAIDRLVIKTGHRLSGREVQIPTSSVVRLSYEESKVFVNMTAQALELSPAHSIAPAVAAD